MTTKSRVEKLARYTYPVVNMGQHIREMENILSDFTRTDVVNRIWHYDYTLWKPDPAEIKNRLGWLNIIDFMMDRIPELESFAEEVKNAGFHHVVLLGMGGSSLGPEVLRQTFGSGPGYPPLIVLDSTVPDAVDAVTREIEPRHTLFLVSSKSGTTIETLSFYRYFRRLADRDVGEIKSGLNFVAITDEGTPLERLAREKGFRRAFINPHDIGGRYSVLSYFGLVPAALTGINIRALIESADRRQKESAPCVDIFRNPGVWLGALIGNMALHGYDKLTFIISPSIRSFGLWVEQLMAESTGKEGKGIIPVIDEPLANPDYYGNDRLFVYLRLKGDANARIDAAVERLEISGCPIIQLEINDQNDLGAEFFRWEMAVAAAGIILRINPFDQPDVQSAKNSAKQVIQEFELLHSFPSIPVNSCPDRWLDQVKAGNYLAVMVYLKPSPALGRALADLRKKVLHKYHIATTIGFGPRFLHSSGQLHKGGPDSGFFLQITPDRVKDLAIPGSNYTFGVLTEAEAQGDYRALEAKKRRVTRLMVSSATGKAIDILTREILNL